MPLRRRIAVPVTLLAVVALAAGCEIKVNPGSVSAPFSVAPVPSASAGQPAYVCTAIYKILTDGAVKAAAYATGTDDAAKDGLRQTFGEMATQVTAAGAKSEAPAQRTAADLIAARLTAASTATDPKAFLNGEFSTISQKIDDTCP
ncbi:hypothetical protein Acy02nite_29110 [Actinoplanes cyaneus]|uniref:Lipoprotein n=1 Tax=Actinoplanes cyaneus TaxID=52696 RepID=A0A919M0D5_9ACTN|nr:hypothetical protein [Actinoplanes cyaneus]MCW2137764.1 hypothetical protein [Actinoplanes cyaneus]GID65030.1 hypothetical protein Acy02nite_29110 [Actinoplanes cyaneus]